MTSGPSQALSSASRTVISPTPRRRLVARVWQRCRPLREKCTSLPPRRNAKPKAAPSGHLRALPSAPSTRKTMLSRKKALALAEVRSLALAGPAKNARKKDAPSGAYLAAHFVGSTNLMLALLAGRPWVVLGRRLLTAAATPIVAPKMAAASGECLVPLFAPRTTQAALLPRVDLQA